MTFQLKKNAFCFGPFLLDASDLLFRDGERIPLEPIQSRVLRALLQSGGSLVTKAEFIQEAWHGSNVSDESIARAIYWLRKSLGKRKDEYIEAVSGKGYRFVVPTSVLQQVSTQDVSLAESADTVGALNAVRALANDRHAMLGYWDMNLRCQSANSAYEVWFGRSQSMMIGIRMAELLGPLFQMNLPYIKDVQRGQPQHFRRLITLPNGVERASLASYFPDFRDGRVAGFSVLVVDAERFSPA